MLSDAGADKLDPQESQVDLSGWSFAVQPRDEWRQMSNDAWRLERDYFYDRGMHGLDWSAVRKKYEPLVERVTDRAELDDLIADMVSELRLCTSSSWLATCVRARMKFLSAGSVPTDPRFAGRRLSRGTHLSSRPRRAGIGLAVVPTRRDVAAGDVIVPWTARPLLGAADIGQLLRARPTAK